MRFYNLTAALRQKEVGTTVLQRKDRESEIQRERVQTPVSVITCDWSVVLVEVNSYTSPLPSADAAASSSTQRNGHHPVHIGQHDGHTNA